MTKNTFMPIGDSIFNISQLQCDLREASPSGVPNEMNLWGTTQGIPWQTTIQLPAAELLTILNDVLSEQTLE